MGFFTTFWKIRCSRINQVYYPILGGKGGGGKKELAQGGGIEPAKSEEAINKTIDYIKSKI